MIYFSIISFIIGVVLKNYFNIGFVFSLFLVFVSLAVFLVLRFGKSQKSQRQSLNCPGPKRLPLAFFLVFLFFAIGVLRMNFVENFPDPNLLKLVGQKISFEAKIVEEPDVRDTSARYTVKPNFSSEYVSECTDIFLLKNSSCSPQSGSQGIQKHIPSKSLVLLITDRFPEYKYGDRISVSGKLQLPKNFANDNGTEFDYVSYLSKNRIHFLIYYPEINSASSSSAGLYGTGKIVSTLYSLKNIFIQKISNVVPEPNSSLIAGMIFGVKQSLGQELLDDFKKVGLIHIVVLSGYNITIIAAGVFWFTSIFGKRNSGFIVSAILILLFALMTGFSATVIRAVIMALISILALYLGRPADALRWLFIAGLLMLLWNPLLLFYDPSFQLSFAATLGLILFSEIIDKKFISQIIRLALKIGVPVSFIVAFEKMKMREIISSTLAVQLFILPLLIKMSGFVSIISFLINPLLLPLTPTVMAFGALTGAFGLLPFIGGFLSWPFGAISYILTQIIISITEFSANLSLATLQTGSISIWFVLVWYFVCGVLYFKNRPNSLNPS